MTNPLHKLIELVLFHQHAHVNDRADEHGIDLEDRGRQVIMLRWPAENPDHVVVNGVRVDSLRLLRACRERRAKLLGTEDRIGEIVEGFVFESSTP